MDIYFISIYYALKIDCTYIHFQLDVLQLFNYLYHWTTMVYRRQMQKLTHFVIIELLL